MSILLQYLQLFAPSRSVNRSKYPRRPSSGTRRVHNQSLIQPSNVVRNMVHRRSHLRRIYCFHILDIVLLLPKDHDLEQA